MSDARAPVHSDGGRAETLAGGRRKRTDRPQISVVIVNYNVKDFLQQALLSLRKALAPFRAEIFVVDNASHDGSAEMVGERFPDVHLIRSRKNLGFARANNLALRRAKGDFFVLLNPDTIVQEDTFVRLLEFMARHPDAGMASCKVLNPDGSLQLACRRSYPTPWVAFTRLTGLSYLFPNSKLFGKYNMTYLPEDEISPVEAISGSFMMVRREVVEQVGLLDEQFFLYGEDLDWCYRVIQAGWQIYYVPTTQIIHFKGESSKQSQFDSLLVFNQAMALFVKKHFRKRYYFLTYYLLVLAIWSRAFFSFAKSTCVRALPVVVDLLLVQLGLILALLVRFGHLDFWDNYLPVNAIYTTAWLVMLALCGSYSRWKFSFFRAAIAVAGGFIFNSALTFFFRQYAYSRAVLLYSGLFNLLLVAGWRLTFKLLHRIGLAPFAGTLGHTLLARRTLVVGDFSRGEAVLEKLQTRFDGGYEIVGLVSLNPDDVGKRYCDLPVVADSENIRDAIGRHNIQDVIFSTHRIAYDRVLGMIANGRSSRVNFKLIPSNLDVIIGKASIDPLSEVPLVDIDYRLSHPRYRLFKRSFDLAVASTGLVLAMPFFLLLLVFRWRQFRWATIDLEEGMSGQRLHVYELPDAGWLGRVLWLWPVLRGQLSIVGREISFDSGNQIVASHLKLGLTGLVQVNRHRNLKKPEKERYQLFYLMNYSVLLDVEIIFKAIFKL